MEHATRRADSRTRRFPSGLTIPAPDRLYFVSATILDVLPTFPAHSFLDFARYTYIPFVPTAIALRSAYITIYVYPIRLAEPKRSRTRLSLILARSPSRLPQSCSLLVCTVLRTRAVYLQIRAHACTLPYSLEEEVV